MSVGAPEVDARGWELHGHAPIGTRRSGLWLIEGQLPVAQKSNGSSARNGVHASSFSTRKGATTARSVFEVLRRARPAKAAHGLAGGVWVAKPAIRPQFENYANLTNLSSDSRISPAAASSHAP